MAGLEISPEAERDLIDIGAYVIYFQPNEDGIRVARVLHGARDHGALL